MTVAMAIKVLAEGQLPNAKGTLYTVPALTATIIKTITYVNTGLAAQAVNLYIKKSGSTSRRIMPKDMILGIDFLFVMDDELTLDVGDLIEGDAANPTEVDYTVNGVEKT